MLHKARNYKELDKKLYIMYKRFMTHETYRKALEEAIHEYERLAKQRAEIDERIAHLVQTIGTLSRLCNFIPTLQLGLTDACRMVLKSAGHPLAAAEVRLQLEAAGMDFSRYSNPLASIHTVHKRLCRSGEAKFVAHAHERPAYAWQRPVRIVAARKRSDLVRLTKSIFAETGSGEGE